MADDSARTVQPEKISRILLYSALGMLVLTAALGDTSALGAAGQSQGALRAHVHAGSVGWMAICVLSLATTMLAPPQRSLLRWQASGTRLAWLVVITVTAFVGADAFQSLSLEAASGAGALLAIVGFLGWLVGRSWRADIVWTTARLGLLSALVILVAGSVVGAISATTAASGDLTAANMLATSHSAALVVPFVVLATTALVEWSASLNLGPEDPASFGGLTQIGLLSLAAAALLIGSLMHDLALIEANIPLEFAGIVLFLVRVGPSLLTRGWTRNATVWLGTSSVLLAGDIGLFAHVVFEIAQRRYLSIDLVPLWLQFVVDHVTFVAVGTTALFGAVAAVSGPGYRWQRADAPAAAGIVAGLVGTAVGIGSGSRALEGAFGSLLALSLLSAAVVAAVRAAELGSAGGA